MNEETWGYVHAVGFELVIHLMLERPASAILAQTLAKKWYDTTHTFHIIGWEMIITPLNFHCMTSLRFDGAPISLEDKSGVWLGAKLLGRRYATEMIHYTNLEADFRL
uniref:Aminotransferase-like plant mobile domain-containing protein n=1 Tax=Quercus lobata TaxID=97700 RepID=A0A7N2L9M4_QUELO